MNNDKITLQDILEREISQEEAFEYFDSLASVELPMMRGLWRGQEVSAGNPMEGILTACGWYGKRFESDRDVHPLVFQTKRGKLYNVNPRFLPFNTPMYKLPHWVIKIFFAIISPFIRTKGSKSRLARTEYRGHVSASMIYDEIAVTDVFRCVDNDTVFGIMDFKHNPTDKYFFFVLRRS